MRGHFVRRIARDHVLCRDQSARFGTQRRQAQGESNAAHDRHSSACGNGKRRAEAVRQYLIAQFAIDESRLKALGFGKARLFDPSRPEDGVNRRVQVLNLTASAAARSAK